ncbi:peptidoglycan-binding domain-containing protein [Streptomyces sp. NPDC003635]
MVQQCFTPAQAGVDLGLASLFGRIAEWFVKKEYCLAKGGCSEFVTLPVNAGTDFFDENAGTTRCRYLAAFLKFHNPALDENFLVQTCEIRKRAKRPGDENDERFPVPDIITHEPPQRMEYYEIKPNSASGKADGRTKLIAFQALVDFFKPTVPTLTYQRGILFDPDRSILIWDGTWFGSPVKVHFHFFREEEGLIVYEVCVEVSGQLLAEVFAKALIKMAVLAVLLLLVPVAAPAFAWNSPLGGSVGAGGVNEHQDTRYVQALLNDWRGRNGRSLISLDGLVGDQTVSAVQDFQTAVTGVVDGRVDVNAQAIAALEQTHLDGGIAAAQLAEMQELGTEGMELYVFRPDPDGPLLEETEPDPVTAMAVQVQQYFDDLHREV